MALRETVLAEPLWQAPRGIVDERASVCLEAVCSGGPPPLPKGGADAAIWLSVRTIASLPTLDLKAILQKNQKKTVKSGRRIFEIAGIELEKKGVWVLVTQPQPC